MQIQTHPFSLIPAHSPLQRVHDELYKKHNITLYIKRDDLLHRHWGGNKARKLLGHVQQFMEGNYNGWISWGGPWSNHLHAFAAFSKMANIPFHVIIRGNDFTYHTPLIDFIKACGGGVHFVSREQYANSKNNYCNILTINGNWYPVPEGAGGEPGQVGCQFLAEEILRQVSADRICLAVGTQTTLLGVAQASTCAITGFSALKGIMKLDERIEITDEFCLGGYAKTSPELFDFILYFFQRHHVLLDPVYTAKMMLGVHRRIARGEWDGETIVVIHSGGLQGIFGYPQLLKLLRALEPEILNSIYKVDE